MKTTIRTRLVLPEKMQEDWLMRQETHAGLWLDKYIKNPSWEATASRKALLEEVTAIPLPAAYRAYYNHWERTLNAYAEEQGIRYATAKGRLLIGMGNESVLETAIALHHTYGVPYIPGSALKGLAANYVHQKLQGAWEKGGDWHTIVFGKTEEAGFITFFDALYIPPPEDKPEPILYQDVISVHHPEYYRDTDPNAIPADWDSPIPITFLSTRGSYLLALAAPELEERTPWLQATFQILELALADWGIGAKTSSGYGRMEVKATRPPEKL